MDAQSSSKQFYFTFHMPCLENNSVDGKLDNLRCRMQIHFQLHHDLFFSNSFSNVASYSSIVVVSIVFLLAIASPCRLSSLPQNRLCSQGCNHSRQSSPSKRRTTEASGDSVFPLLCCTGRLPLIFSVRMLFQGLDRNLEEVLRCNLAWLLLDRQQRQVQ